MIHWIAQAFSTYVLHPLHGNGYQWWSGAGSDLGEVSILAVFVGAAKHHNCHHKGCKKLGHRHPEFGWPACRTHWNERPQHLGVRDDGDVIGHTTEGGNW